MKLKKKKYEAILLTSNESKVINMCQKRYINTVSDALSLAQIIVSSAQLNCNRKIEYKAVNLLAAAIYFFTEFHPVYYKNGKKLHRFFHYIKYHKDTSIEEGDLLLGYRNWTDWVGLNVEGEIIISFTNDEGFDLSLDENRNLVEFNNPDFNDLEGNHVKVTKNVIVDDNGEMAVPDTLTGEYSDLAHVISFLNRDIDSIFYILRQDKLLKYLTNGAYYEYMWKEFDTIKYLRLCLSRLYTPEVYFNLASYNGLKEELILSDVEGEFIESEEFSKESKGSPLVQLQRIIFDFVKARGKYLCREVIPSTLDTSVINYSKELMKKVDDDVNKIVNELYPEGENIDEL